MLTILLPLLTLLLLPTSAANKWAASISAYCIAAFLSIKLLYTPSTPQMTSSLFLLDQLSSTMIALSIWISLLMILNSNKVMKLSLDPKLFCFLVSTLLIVLILSFSANKLILFYILFEISLIPTLMLILFWGYQPERLQASMYLMMYTTVASLPLLVSILLISSKSSSTLITLNMYISPSLNFMSFSTWWMFCLLAFLVKMPMYTTHLWLPKAHVEAPVAGSMILAGILLKLGGYGMLRMFQMFPLVFASINYIVVAISLVGSLYTAMICTRQPDMKSLIAYASVSHMALLLSSMMLPSIWSLTGALSMMIAHGLASSALFALANTMYETSKTRSLTLTKGILSIYPAVSLWLFLAAIANLGAPPTMNLAAEIMLLTNLLNKSMLSLLPIALMSFYTAAYSLILFTSSQHNSCPEFYNPMSMPPLFYHTSSFLHLTPLALFVLKPDICSMWLV